MNRVGTERTELVGVWIREWARLELWGTAGMGEQLDLLSQDTPVAAGCPEKALPSQGVEQELPRMQPGQGKQEGWNVAHAWGPKLGGNGV